MFTFTRFFVAAAAASSVILLAACSGQPQSSVIGTPGTGSQPALPDALTPGPGSGTSTIVTIPNALSIRGTGSSFNGTFVAKDTQPNFQGTITAKSSNAAIATVSPPSIHGQSGTFTVTPVAIGTCLIRLSDGTSRKNLKVTITSVHGIYVTNRATESIEAFDLTANGNIAPTAVWKGKKTHLDVVNLLTVDSNANVWASNIGPGIAGSVTEYAANPTANAAPIAMLTGSNTGINTPEGIVVDSSGNSFISNADRIVEFAPGANGNAVPTNTIAGSNTLLSGPYELAMDTTGKLYVAEGNVILVYAAGATGNVAPAQEITGPATALLSCLGLAVDAAGNIYATNFNGNTINVYAAGATGNVKPTTVITSTALNEPYNIALDAHGNMFVTNFGNNSVVVFPAGSSGATTPSATISGALTGLHQPQGIVVF
jgi:hypothetical protein